MQKLREIYRNNVYGVIGTLVFHILLFSSFLFADVNRKGIVKEEEIVIEFPDNIPEPETLEESEPENNVDSRERPDQMVNDRTNIASNRLAQENITQSADEFFDDDYLKELEAAKQLVSDVNKNLEKEIVDLGEIKMPVETTEGMDPDSIKNVIYAGESNIVYYLENRHHVSLPVPVYLSQGGGKVIVEIKVNQQGRVIEAKAQNGATIRDKQILLYAQEAASRTIFNSDKKAAKIQKGTIHYTFVAQ